MKRYTYSTHRNGRSLLTALILPVAILALAGSLTHAQSLTNWLTNPGFESGTTNWVNMPPWVWSGATFATESTNDYVYSNPQQTTKHVTVHSGANAFKIWGYFQSYPTATWCDADTSPPLPVPRGTLPVGLPLRPRTT